MGYPRKYVLKIVVCKGYYRTVGSQGGIYLLDSIADLKSVQLQHRP